jgi:hypothetical protein
MACGVRMNDLKHLTARKTVTCMGTTHTGIEIT